MLYSRYVRRNLWLLSRRVLLLSAVTIVGISTLRAEDSSPKVPPPGTKFYKSENGKFDSGTLRGWQVFHSSCYVCHGVDALGTDVGPNLVERVKHMSITEFSNKVLNRYRIVMPMNEATADNNIAWREAMIQEMERHERSTRGELVMPAWKDNFRVRPHLVDLYAYLQARADGVLGPGEPVVMPDQP